MHNRPHIGIRLLSVLLAALGGIGAAGAGDSGEIEKLKQGLQNPKDAARVEAIRKLKVTGVESVRAADILVPLLGDKSFQVQQAASAALVKIGADGAAALGRALASDDPKLRRGSLLVLEQLGPKARDAAPALAKIMVGPDFTERQRAQATLVRIGAPAASALAKEIPANRKFVLATLRQLGPAAKDALPELVALLKDKDVTTRRDAVMTVESLAAEARPALPVLTDLLRDPDPQVRAHAASALVRVGPDAVPALLAILNDIADQMHWPIAANVIQRLEAQDKKPVPEFVPALAKQLEHKELQVRFSALVILQGLGPRSKEAAPALVRLLDDENGNLRSLASHVLVNIGADVIPVLQEQLKNPNPEVRAFIIGSLGRLGNRHKEVIPVLRSLLNDKDVKTRQATITALGQLRAIDTVAPLADALRDEEPEVRRAAVIALQQMAKDARAAQPALIAALRDPDPQVRNLAANVLRTFGADTLPALLATFKGDSVESQIAAAGILGSLGKAAQDAIPLLAERARSENASLQSAVLDALIRLLPESLPALTRLLTDKRVETRWATATALQKAGPAGKEVLDILLDAMRDRDESVRNAAAGAVARFGPAALAPLGKQLEDKESRALAARTLANIPGAKASVLPALTEAARAGETAAAVALARSGRVALPLLSELTEHKTPTMRSTALTALLAFGPPTPETLDRLPRLLKDVDADVRGAASRLLSRAGAAEIKAHQALLIQALADKDWQTRRSAGFALAKLGPEVVAGLIEVVDKSNVPTARIEAILTLGSLGAAAKDSVKTLVEVVREPDVQLRSAALTALAQMSPEADAALAELLTDPDSGVRVTVLRAMKPEQAQLSKTQLVKLLRDTSAEVRAASARALGRLGAAVVMDVRPLLADNDPAVRAAAIQTLETAESPAALGKFLGDEKAEVREAATVALAKRKSLAYAVLADALRSRDYRVQRAAANAIVPVQERADELIPVLVDVLLIKETDEREAQAIARAIQRVNPVFGARELASKASIAALLTLLKKESPEIQELACLALAERGRDAEEAERPLTDVLKQPKIDVSVLGAAARALNAVGAPDAAYRVEPDLIPRLVQGSREKSRRLREEVMAELLQAGDRADSLEAILSALTLGQFTEEANEWVIHHANATQPTGVTSMNLLRVLGLFQRGDKPQPGPLTAAAEQALKEYFWRFLHEPTPARGAGLEPRSLADVKTTLPIENMMWITTAYLALDLLKDDPAYKDRQLHDRPLADLYQTWTIWWREWARQRPARGLWSEMGFPNHQIHIWPSMLNLHDCASDPVIKQRIKMLLDLTAIEEEQVSIQGTRVGRRGRRIAPGCELDQWKDLLLGEQPRRFGENTGGYNGILWTTRYEPPTAVLLLRKLNRPVTHYVVANQHFFGGSVYALATPHYVLGSQLSQPRGSMEFLGVWHRLIFDDMNAIFFPLPDGDRRHFQHQNVYIMRWSGNQTERQTIDFTADLKVSERKDWVFFSNGPAYVGIHIEGGYEWIKSERKEPGRKDWNSLLLKNPRFTVLLHASDMHTFASFEKFQEAILRAPLKIGESSLEYSSPDLPTIEFFQDPSRSPRVADTPRSMRSETLIYDSPYLQGKVGESHYTVRFGPYSATYDFDRNTIVEEMAGKKGS